MSIGPIGAAESHDVSPSPTAIDEIPFPFWFVDDPLRGMAPTDTFPHMSRSRRTTTALIALCMTAAACSGSSTGTDERTTAEPAPPPATIGETGPPSVTDATTTTSTSTTTTTTVAPTTSIDEAATLIAEIEADLNEGERAFLAAGAQPGAQESRDLVGRYFAGEALQRVIASLEALARDGLVVRQSASVESTIEVLEVIDSTLEIATVRLCLIDAAVVVVAPTDASPEIIVNDVVRRSVTSSSVQRVDDVWAISSSETTEDTEGATTCDGL
jgi:hypothetical protein